MSLYWLAGKRESEGRAVVLAASEVHEVVRRVFAREDVLQACARRDLGLVVEILCRHGMTQGQIAGLTGIAQGRLSEWARHKRVPRASSTFEAFADGLDVPPAARQALGLAPAHTAVSPPPGVSALQGLDAVRCQLQYASPSSSSSASWVRRAFSPREAWKIEIDFDNDRVRSKNSRRSTALTAS